MPLKEVFDQPETMWLQFRRRLDRLYPFCRIAGHKSRGGAGNPGCFGKRLPGALSAAPESATQAEPGVEPALSPPKRGWRKKRSETEAQGGEMRIPAPLPDESGARSVPGDGRSQTEPKRPRRVGGPKPKRDAVSAGSVENHWRLSS